MEALQVHEELACTVFLRPNTSFSRHAREQLTTVIWPSNHDPAADVQLAITLRGDKDRPRSRTTASVAPTGDASTYAR